MKRKDIQRLFGKGLVDKIAASMCAILIGLFVGFLVLLASNPDNALSAFLTILKGGLSGGSKGIGNVLFKAIPIIMTGLSVAIAFKAGMFNIGTPGQFIMGAYTAIYIGCYLTFLPPVIHWLVCILSATAVGALWVLIPALLKAFLNVNEVIATIMMNYIGMYTSNYLITKYVFDANKNQSKLVAASAQTPKLGMDKLFPGSSLNAGIFVALLCMILIYVLLQRSTFGYELKACGQHCSAARYAGINEKKCIVMTLLIAGALAGLGGGLTYVAGDGRSIFVVDVLAQEGFTGISVALLAMNHPIAIFFSGIFIASLTVGGFYMQLYQYPYEVIDIIIAIIIYFSAISLLVRKLMERWRNRQEVSQ